MTYEQIAGELMMTTEDVEARATEIERTYEGQLAAQLDDPALRKSMRESLDEIEAGGDAKLARGAVELRQWLDDLDRQRPVW
jgi:succinylarginine dihydrolase